MNRKKMNTGKLMIIISLTVMIFIAWNYFSESAVISSGTKIGYTDKSTRNSWHAEYEKLDGTFIKTIYPKTIPQEIHITAETISGSIDILAECGDEILFDGHDLQSGHVHILAEGKVKVTVKATDHKGSIDMGIVDGSHTH